MPRVKEIQLNPFEYHFQGQVMTGDTILVQEIGFDNIRIHRAMSHHVMQALMGMEKHRSTLDKAKDQPKTIDADGEESDGAEQIMQLFAMAVDDIDKYQRICDDIQSIMTNRPTIARVAGTDAPITEVCWRGIAQTNGIDGVNRVLSVFSAFFLEGPAAPSRKETGPAASIISYSPTPAASVSRKPEDFLSGNSVNLRRI
jgi:hypothetical protein